MAATLKRRLARAGAWKLAKRIVKPIPVVGAVVTVGLAGYEVKKKGALRGAIHVGLDLLPVVGTLKGAVEVFTGDLIPDREPPRDTAENRATAAPRGPKNDPKK